MLTLSEIEKVYPESLRGFKRFILREYLQHKLLQILFDSEYANELCFLGGTCLRIVHGNTRFSEDLDFTILDETELVNDLTKSIKSAVNSLKKAEKNEMWQKQLLIMQLEKLKRM